MNEGSPGVSIRLTFTSRHSNEASDAEMDMPRDFSSSSASETVVPSATEPSRVVAPASKRSASCSDVFPLPRWPTNATLRILSAGWDIPGTSLSAASPALEGEMERLRLPEVVALEATLEPQHGLRVQLRDARLGDAEDLADLAQGQVLVVVERDHELLALWQRGDRVGEAVLELGGVEDLLRVRRVGVVQRVQQRHLVAARVRHGPELVERHDRGVGDLDERLLEVLDGDVELARHLLVGRGTVQAMLELAVYALDLAGAGADGARDPVERAQLVDDRALDAGDRVGLELDLAIGVEALDRVDQPDQAIGDEVGLLDVRGQAGGHPAGDVLHQRRIGDHELLAGSVRAAPLVATPELSELDRFDVGLQVSPPKPVGGCVHTLPVGALTLPECRSGWWRCCCDRAAPGSRGDRLRPPGDGWRMSAAAREDAPLPEPRRGGSTRADGGARRRSRGAGRTSRGTARARRDRLRARCARARDSAPRRAAPAPRRVRTASWSPCRSRAAARRRTRPT